MNQKIIAAMSMDALAALQKNAAMIGSIVRASSVVHAGIDVTLVAIYPHHAHLRFELAEAPGITVLPVAHDPEPIGATVSAALAHVNALPTETMRAVALRLYVLHGPAFHPDT